MTASADAVVTGFAKSPALVEQSLAPLRQLRRDNILRHIHYLTWDTPDIDAYLAPLEEMDDVIVTRVPPPVLSGPPGARSVQVQIASLEAALALVPETDRPVLKWRPDFVADAEFLRRKLLDFGRLCAIPGDRAPMGVKMPPPPFRNKIWIPWADSNQPFFYEDAALLGRKCDLERLNISLTPQDMETLTDPDCGHYCHLVRFAKPFLAAYPLFANYLANFPLITSDWEYRREAIPVMLDDGYFWFLAVAHAWILHSQFHVDCGQPGELRFYSNYANRTTDWSDPSSWKIASPYDDVQGWREGTKPGLASYNVGRVFGRLMDDHWQDRLVAGEQSDLPPDVLAQLLENIAGCGDGRLAEIEAGFYRMLGNFRADYLNR